MFAPQRFWVPMSDGAAGGITGTLAVTNAADTLSAAGSPIITGSLARTNANDALAAAGSPIVSGSLAKTNADDTLTWQDAAAWPNAMRKARFLSAVDHVQLDRLRYVVMQALDGLFTQCDVLIGPFMTGPMLIASNYTGHPCLHLRAGFEELGTRSPASLASGSLTTGEADTAGTTFTVPQGISLWGRLFDEGPILNLGMALEAALAVADRRPEFPR